MKQIILHFILWPWIFINLGCESLDENQIPKVQQAWNARYQYELENRRIVSVYEKRKVGRAIGRDEFGRINYDRYWVMSPFKGENLLKSHEAKLNLMRENRWNLANRNLIEARKIKMSEVATNENNEEEEKGGRKDLIVDDSLPAPFLPTGISLEFDAPNDDAIMALPPSFEGVPPSLPLPVDGEALPPSPFDPLPPL